MNQSTNQPICPRLPIPLPSLQYSLCSDEALLSEGVEQMRCVRREMQRSPKEREAVMGMRTLVQTQGGTRNMSVLESAVGPVRGWVERWLRDYHRHFPQGEGGRRLEECLETVMLATRILREEEERDGVGGGMGMGGWEDGRRGGCGNTFVGLEGEGEGRLRFCGRNWLRSALF